MKSTLFFAAIFLASMMDHEVLGDSATRPTTLPSIDPQDSMLNIPAVRDYIRSMQKRIDDEKAARKTQESKSKSVERFAPREEQPRADVLGARGSNRDAPGVSDASKPVPAERAEPPLPRLFDNPSVPAEQKAPATSALDKLRKEGGYINATGAELAAVGPELVGQRVRFSGRLVRNSAFADKNRSTVLDSLDGKLRIRVFWDAHPQLGQEWMLLRQPEGSRYVLKGTIKSREDDEYIFLVEESMRKD